MTLLLKVYANITGDVSGPARSTWWFGPGDVSPAAAVSAVGGFYDDIKSFLWEGITYTTDGTCDVIDSTDGSLQGVVSVTPIQVIGTSGSDPVATVAQARIDWSTGTFENHRQLKGRVFIAGCVSPGSSAGHLDTDLVAVLNTGIANFIADTDSDPIVFSRTHNVFASISAGEVWPKWAVLRSRRD